MKIRTSVLFLFLSGFNSAGAGDLQSDYGQLRLLIGKKEYAAAFAQCQTLINQYPQSVGLYETLAETGLYSRQFQAARDFLAKRIENRNETPLSLYALALLHHRFGNLHEAIRIYRKAIDQGIELPDCYRALAEGYESLVGVENAIDVFSQICFRRPENPNNHYALVMMYWVKGDFAKALRHLEGARMRDPEEPRYREVEAVGKMLMDCSEANVAAVGECYWQAKARGDYNGMFFLEANLVMGLVKVQSLDSAASRIKVMAGEADKFGFQKWFGWALMLEADLSFCKGEYLRSLELSRKSIEAYRQANEVMNIPFLLRLQYMSSSELGDFDQAMASTIRRIDLSAREGYRTRYVEALSDLATSFHELSLDAVASEYAAQALTKAYLFGVQPSTGFIAETAMGVVQEGQGRHIDAIAHFNAALQLADRGSFSNVLRSIAHGNLGRLELTLGNLEKAQQHLTKQNLLIARGNYRREELLAHVNWGDYYLKTGMVARARRSLFYARNLAYSLESPGAIALVERKLARLDALSGNRYGSIQHYRNAIGAVMSSGPTVMTNRRQYASDARELVNLLCECELNDEAFRTSEQSRLNHDVPYRLLTLLQDAGSLTPTQRARVRDARANLTELLTLLEGSSALSLGWDWPSKELTRLNHLIKEHGSLKSLLAEVSSMNESLIRELSPQPISLIELRERVLEDSTVLLTYTVGEHRSSAILVTPDTLWSRQIPAGGADIERLVAKLSRVLRPDGGEIPIITPSLALFDLNYSDSLYALLVEPFAKALDQYERLIIIPDGALTSLPFEALPMPEGGGLDRPRWGRRRYLGERFEISYGLASSLLRTKKGIRSEPSREVLAVGSPNGTGENFSIPSPLADASDEPLLVELPGATRELKGIGRIFGAMSDVVLDERATREHFVKSASKYRVLHVAAHGKYDRVSPWHSSIYFSRGSTDTCGRELKAFELLALDLAAELVVLSSCNTGRHQYPLQSGGILHGLSLVGVPAVISPLWSIDDETTADLMIRFYSHLKGGERASKALQRAKIELIRTGRSDPYYWAGFILVGDPGPVSFLPQRRTEIDWVFWLIIPIAGLLLGVAGFIAGGRSMRSSDHRTRPTYSIGGSDRWLLQYKRKR